MRRRVALSLVALLAPLFVSVTPAKAAVVWTEIYETTTSNRDAATNTSMVYTNGFGKTGGAASTFSGSWDRIKIRMEMTQVSNNTKYYAEVAFDKWAGATLASLQFPDYANLLVLQKNVTNLLVTSDTSAVRTGSFALGRVEFWPSNYSQSPGGVSPASSSGLYDWDDTVSVVADGHGSYQVHNLTDTQTIMAWNMHRPAGPPDLGLGAGPASNPDWTSMGNATWKNTNFLVQVFVGQTITSTSVNAPTLTGNGAKSATTTLKATASIAGKVTFLSNNKKIPGCIRVSTVDVAGTPTATCVFRPNTSGQVKYSAQLFPTDGSLQGSSSPISVIQIGRRTGTR